MQLSEAPFAPLHVSDVIMVDVDEYDTPVGIESRCPCLPSTKTTGMRSRSVVPEVKVIFAGVFPL